MIARFGEQVYYLQTKTAPVLETPRRAGLRIIRRLVTAGKVRHDAISCRHTRGLGNGNQWKTAVFHDFLLPAPWVDLARSHREHKGMYFSTPHPEFGYIDSVARIHAPAVGGA